MAAIASPVLQAVGVVQQSEAQARASEFNARVAREKAQLQKAQTAADVERQRRESRLRLGAVRAAAGAQGGITGSALDIIASSAVQEELDILNIQQAGQVAEQDILTGARLDVLEAEQARTAGKIGAASQILGGVTSAVRTVATAGAGA